MQLQFAITIIIQQIKMKPKIWITFSLSLKMGYRTVGSHGVTQNILLLLNFSEFQFQIDKLFVARGTKKINTFAFQIAYISSVFQSDFFFKIH